MEILVIVVGAALFAVVAYLSYQARQRRLAALRSLAAAKGWQFSPGDPFGLPHHWDVEPFGSGYARHAENVISGAVRGWPIVAFDYSYKEDSTDADGDRRTTTYRFGVCVLRLPVPLAEVRVSPENLLSRIGQALGFSDIELESEDFNRRYRVSSPHPKFACDVLPPRTMELLLRGESIQFRVYGADVICWHSGNHSPAEIIMRTEMLAGFADGVPAFVWKDFGFDPHQRAAVS